MIPMANRPPGYLLKLSDLTEAVYWAKSLSGAENKAQLPFETLLQFKLAEWKDGMFNLSPAFYDWVKEFDAMHSIDMHGMVVWLQWFGE